MQSGVLQNQWPPTGHRPPRTDHRPTNRSSTDTQTTDPPTSAPTTHRPSTTDSPACPPSTHRPPTNDHQLTSRSSIDPLIIELPTYRPSYNWQPTLWLTKLTLTESPLDSTNSSFEMGTIYEFVKLFIKWMVKKNLDKLQILWIIAFGNWYLRIRI